MNDLPEIPELQPVTRRVEQISAELAEALQMIQCERCQRYWPQDWMMKPGTRFRAIPGGAVIDVYALHPTCRVCAEDSLREDDGHSGWFEIKDQPRRI